MVITVHFRLNAPLWQHTLNSLQQARVYVPVSQDSVDDVEGSVVKCPSTSKNSPRDPSLVERAPSTSRQDDKEQFTTFVSVLMWHVLTIYLLGGD